MRSKPPPKRKYTKTQNPLARAIRVLRFLVDHRFGGTIDDLAAEADVSRRQTYRILKCLEESGVKLTGFGIKGPTKSMFRLADRVTWANRMGVI